MKRSFTSFWSESIPNLIVLDAKTGSYALVVHIFQLNGRQIKA